MTPANLAVGDRTSWHALLQNNTAPEGNYSYELILPAGVKASAAVKGTVKLKHGRAVALSIPLTAVAASNDNIQLELTGPNNFRFSQNWPLIIRGEAVTPLKITANEVAPQKNLTLTIANKIKAREAGLLLLASPMPLLDAPDQLQNLMQFEPVATIELAQWLEATHLWQNELTAFGLSNDDTLRTLRGWRLRQLLQRQTNDGGFAALPSSDATSTSDLISTAAALTAMQAETNNASAQAAAQIATSWLQHKLENTWFDEAERPARAAAFLALAVTNHVDVSGLRYFADTSGDKQLDSVAQAQLAQALITATRDEAAARNWLQPARAALPAMLEAHKVESWQLLRSLAANPLITPRELQQDLLRAPTGSLPPAATIALLQMVWQTNQRIGGWRLDINGTDTRLAGIYQLPFPEKTTLVLHNATAQSYFVTQLETGAAFATPVTKTTGTVNLQRQFYQLDGTAIGANEPLMANQLYLLLVRGSNPDLTPDLLATFPNSTAMQILSSPPGNPASFAALWPWLNNLTAVAQTSRSLTAAGFIVPLNRDWRTAYLIKTGASGTYNLLPISLRMLDGTTIAATQNRVQLKIK